MATNPVALQLIGFSQGLITCVSNAANWQRVTLSWAGTEIVFQGTGEGTPMTWGADKQNVHKLPPTAAATTMVAVFEYSTTGAAGPFVRARVQDPIVMASDPAVFTMVTSEDGSDGDNNDSYLSMMLLKPFAIQIAPATSTGYRPSLQPSEHALQDGAMLSMHAKTYYDDPYVHGGDEHYVDVIYNAGTVGTIRYAGTGWHMTHGNWIDKQTPFGGYLTVYVELGGCTHVGLEAATMRISTLIAYWLFRPTGNYGSPNWSAIMLDAQYNVTNVTP